MQNDIVLAIVSTTLLILLLIAIIIIVFFISGRQKIQHEIEKERAKHEFENELRVVQTELSEQLMGQFAQELHDNIGQSLTSIHIQIENQKLDHPQLAESFRPIEVYLEEVTHQLRLLSRTLNGDFIGNNGLFAALQLEADRINSLRRFRMHLQNIEGNSGLSKNEQLMLFRIFQEVVQNALRHAKAKNFYVEAKKNTETFELLLKDDGVGFNAQELLNSPKASGLNNILKRAKLAGFECRVLSEKEKGCTVELKKSLT